MSLHKNLTSVDMHIIFAWSYADSTARSAATGFALADVGKVAQQLSDSSYWLLTGYSPIAWAQLAGGAGYLTTTAHRTVRQLIHFIEDGPAEGFTTGAYCETLPVGAAFPTSCIWWTNSGKTAKIVEEDVTWNANNTINTDVWKMYDVDGVTLIATVTDTYDYTGGNFLTPKRTRTIA